MAPPVLAAPSGGSIVYQATNISKADQVLSLTVSNGTTTGTVSPSLLRRETTLVQGTCGNTFGNWETVPFSGTIPNITTTNFEQEKCYQFAWQVSDDSGTTSFPSTVVVTTKPQAIALQTLSVGKAIFVKLSENNLFMSLNAMCTTPLIMASKHTFNTGDTIEVYARPDGIAGSCTWSADNDDLSAATYLDTNHCMIRVSPTASSVTYTASMQGCANTASTTLSQACYQPVVNVSKTTACLGDGTFTMTANVDVGEARSCTWSSAADPDLAHLTYDTTDTSNCSVTVNLTSTTDYTVTIPGCTQAKTITLTIYPLPATPTVTNAPACGSATITASGGAGGTLYYQGTTALGTSTSDAATSKPFSATSTTQYYWRSRSTDGCWSAAASASPTIYAVPATPTVTNAPACGSATITASGGAGGTLYYQGTTALGTSTSDAATSKPFSATSTTKYYWRSRSSNNCWSAAASASPTIYAIPAAVTVTASGVCSGKTLTATGGSGGTIYYQGTTSGGTSTTTPATSKLVTTAGTYYFRSRSTNGCWGTQGSAVAAATYTCMQSWNSCSSYSTPGASGATSIGYLTDSRDGKSYEVRKLPDGKCWMVDSLRYGGGTDGSSDYCAAKTTSAGWRSATSQANSTAIATNGLNPTNGSRNTLVGDCSNIGASITYCQSIVATRCGYYYNWPAVVQSVYAYSGSTTAFGGTIQGICPAGWHVPSKDEFVNLDTAMGGNGAWRTDLAFINAHYMNSAQFKGVWAGVRGSSNQGDGFYVHTSTYYTTDTNYGLGMDTAGTMRAWHPVGKASGLPVRCIKN